LSFETWKTAQHEVRPDPVFSRVDLQIAEASVFLDDGEATIFSARLRSIETETNQGRRSLLMDSLILDLRDKIASKRAHRAALEDLKETSAEVQKFKSSDAISMLERANQCGANTPLNDVIALAEEAKTLVCLERDRQAAEARRNAILQGLARLGYDVHEDMQTAWASNGLVVVKNPALPGYGVEVGGQAQGNRLQVRAVALSANHDETRDKDVETIWCSDFGKLQELLAAHGDNLLIERAMSVGESRG
jgi:hypothetical protein